MLRLYPCQANCRTLLAMREHRASELTLVAATPEEARATAVCDELRARGIRCGAVFAKDPRLRGRGFGALFNGARRLATQHSKVWLVYIDPSDAQRAEGVLERFAASADEPGDDDPISHYTGPV